MQVNQDGYIPKNYICTWTLSMDNTIKYKLYIERSNTYEELSMALYGTNSYYVATNQKLTNTGTNPGEIKDTKTLQLFTRNLNTVSNGTFLL